MSELINTDQQYRIVSLRHTKKTDHFICLWAPNDAGYSLSKERSGVYNGYQPGYHDSNDNIPVPEDQIQRLFINVTYEGQEKHMIPNCKAVWEALDLKWSATGLRRKLQNA